MDTGQGGLPLAVKDRVRTGELSRAAVRLTDLSMLRLDELTKIEILPPARESNKPVLDLTNGATYFFPGKSRASWRPGRPRRHNNAA